MTQQTGGLRTAGTEEAIADLVREPGNPNDQVRWSAAYPLADIGEPIVRNSSRLLIERRKETSR